MFSVAIRNKDSNMLYIVDENENINLPGINHLRIV